MMTQCKPFKLGITGTIASGKSLVGQQLAEQGVLVLDTDKVVAELYAPGSPVLADLARVFGADILTPQGALNRAVLRQRVFSDAQQKAQLEAIVHPLVRQQTIHFLADDSNGAAIKAVLVPLLFEAGTESLYDQIWAVTVEPDMLLKRLMQREQISTEEAQSRLHAQWSQAEKAQRAHVVIDNSASPDNTQQQVVQALQAIRREMASCG